MRVAMDFSSPSCSNSTSQAVSLQRRGRTSLVTPAASNRRQQQRAIEEEEEFIYFSPHDHCRPGVFNLRGVVTTF